MNDVGNQSTHFNNDNRFTYRCLLLLVLAAGCYSQTDVLVDQGSTLILNCTKSGAYFVWDFTKDGSNSLVIVSQDSIIKIAGGSAKYHVRL